MADEVILVHPDGKRGVRTSDPAEINALKLQGYKPAEQDRPAPAGPPRRAPARTTAEAPAAAAETPEK